MLCDLSHFHVFIPKFSFRLCKACGFILLFLFFILYTVVNQVGNILSESLPFSQSFLSVGFALSSAAVLYKANGNKVDRINRTLTILLLASFGCISFYGTRTAVWENLSHESWNDVINALPIAFLALVYGKLIPIVCSNLKGDVKKISKALGIGSVIPLIMYILWEAILLAQISGGSEGTSILNQ